MDLPEFRGEPEEWPVFYSQFVSTTIEGDFSPSQNMTRLRKCLKGEARNAVLGSLALPENVDEVINLLKTRFGNLDAVVKAKIKALNNLPPPLENKPCSIKGFYEFIMNMKITLTSAGATDYLRSPQMLDTITEKLSYNTQRAWMRYKLNVRGSTIDDLLRWYEPYYKCAILQD
jgi:hypothetical protein